MPNHPNLYNFHFLHIDRTFFFFLLIFAVVVQLLSWVQLFAIPWAAACQSSLDFTISWNLLKLVFIEWMMPSNHLILCCPPLLLPFIFPRISIFSNKPTLRIWWPKYCSFSINPSSEYSSLISFRIDQFDLLGVQGTLKNLLQHQSLKKKFSSY